MKISRRTMMFGGGALAALVGVPAALKLRWDARDFTRDGYTPTAPAPPDGRVNWMNWSGAQRATPRDLVTPRTEADLAEFVRASAHRIRPVGSGHSFSALAPSDGYILQSNYFSGLKSLDPETHEARFGSGTRRLRRDGGRKRRVGRPRRRSR